MARIVAYPPGLCHPAGRDVGVAPHDRRVDAVRLRQLRVRRDRPRDGLSRVLREPGRRQRDRTRRFSVGRRRSPPPWSSARSPRRCSAASPTTPAPASASSSASRSVCVAATALMATVRPGMVLLGLGAGGGGRRHVRGGDRLLQLLSAAHRARPSSSAASRPRASPSATPARSSRSWPPIRSRSPTRSGAASSPRRPLRASRRCPSFIVLPADQRHPIAARRRRRPGRASHSRHAPRDPDGAGAGAHAPLPRLVPDLRGRREHGRHLRRRLRGQDARASPSRRSSSCSCWSRSRRSSARRLWARPTDARGPAVRGAGDAGAVGGGHRASPSSSRPSGTSGSSRCSPAPGSAPCRRRAAPSWRRSSPRARGRVLRLLRAGRQDRRGDGADRVRPRVVAPLGQPAARRSSRSGSSSSSASCSWAASAPADQTAGAHGHVHPGAG